MIRAALLALLLSGCATGSWIDQRSVDAHPTGWNPQTRVNVAGVTMFTTGLAAIALAGEPKVGMDKYAHAMAGFGVATSTGLIFHQTDGWVFALALGAAKEGWDGACKCGDPDWHDFAATASGATVGYGVLRLIDLINQ